MNVKPVRQRSVLVRLAKIHKAQKRAAKAAAAEAKAAARAAQGTDEFVKTGFKAKMKTPKFRNWAIGVASALGVAAGVTIPLSIYPAHDHILQAKVRAYGEARGMSERDIDWLDNLLPYRDHSYAEERAGGQQKYFDLEAFQNVLKDNGYEEHANSFRKFMFEEDKLPSGRTTKEAIHNRLYRLQDLLPAKEYQRLTGDAEENDEQWGHLPFYRNTYYQYLIDSLIFRKYLKENGLDDDYGVRRDFKEICSAIKPNRYEYSSYYGFTNPSYNPPKRWNDSYSYSPDFNNIYKKQRPEKGYLTYQRKKFNKIYEDK